MERKKSKEQELAVKFGMFEQQIMIIQQQLKAIEQTLIEMSSLNSGLDDIKKDREIFAPVGRGIFASAKLISEDLIVDIGNKKYVKKTIPETKELIQDQIKKLGQAKAELDKELERINEEITKVMIDHQKETDGKKGQK